MDQSSEDKEQAIPAQAEMKLTAYHKIGGTLLAGFALAVAALLFISWLAEEVLEGDTQKFDERVRAAINEHASPVLTSAMRFITIFGSTIFLIILCLCVVLIFVRIKWRHAARLFGLTMAGALVLNTVLKLSFHRARPTPYFGIVTPSSYSFPSGHALYALCCYGTLAVIITSRLQSRAARLIAWTAAGALILLVGFSRIYLGVHYPSDVLAGYTAAVIWVLAIAFADRLLQRRKARL